MNKDICQFYVVVGDSNFIVPSDNNVYINATNVNDYKLIQDEIFKIYKEKAKLGVKVGSEIIFLVDSISDSEKANDIISKLRLNGKIQVMRKEKREEFTMEKSNDKLEKVKSNEITPPPVRDVFEVLDEIPEKIDNKNDKVEETEEVTRKADNIYKWDFETTNYSGYIGRPIENKDKGGKWPLIIFIISLLLFISSVVLLFVL